MKVTVLEMSEGGYCLRSEDNGGLLQTAGRYPTVADACRIARLNGYEPSIEASADIHQLELTFAQSDFALSA